MDICINGLLLLFLLLLFFVVFCFSFFLCISPADLQYSKYSVRAHFTRGLRVKICLLVCLVSRIKTETGTSIIIPPDTEKSDFIRIEGDPVGVKAAKTMLLDMAAKMVKGCFTYRFELTVGVEI